MVFLSLVQQVVFCRRSYVIHVRINTKFHSVGCECQNVVVTFDFVFKYHHVRGIKIIPGVTAMLRTTFVS